MNFVQITHKDQVRSTMRFIRHTADGHMEYLSYTPNIIINTDSIRSVDCSMNVLTKDDVKHYVEHPEFYTENVNYIEAILDGAKKIYVYYDYFITIYDKNSDVGYTTHKLSRYEYQDICHKLGIDYYDRSHLHAENPTIEELEAYIRGTKPQKKEDKLEPLY